MQSVVEPIKISDSEWEVMRVIWTLGQSDAKEITALLSENKNWKAATVKTLLGRLVKKGVLKTESQGKNLFIRRLFPKKQPFAAQLRIFFLIFVPKKLGRH